MQRTEQQLLTELKVMYTGLTADNLSRLETLYAPEVVFEDPLHRVEGLAALTDYFYQMYQGVEEARFEFFHTSVDGDNAYLVWRFFLRHPRLARGRLMTVDGCTRLVMTDGLVSFHRDYFDLGAMVYEGVPLLGTLVRLVKRRMAQGQGGQL